MAFGHKDTDRVYDDLIVPSLTEKKIKPVRIDRIEYNDDIDDRIMAELQKCDFVIADLTYARPSVYFEAGYAQREVPVVYICRKDHFSPKADDEFGNYRVHFDLQMKNIIPWSSPTDHNFSKRLRARIEKVITPMLRQRRLTKSRDQECARFSALSTNDRLKLVSDICLSEVSAKGYHEVRSDLFTILPRCLNDVISFRTYEQSQFYVASLLERPFRLGIKYKGNSIQSVIIYAADYLRKKDMSRIYTMLRRPPIYSLNPSLQTGRISRLDDYIFFSSLKHVPQARVMEVFTNSSYDEAKDRYMWRAKQHVPVNGVPGFSDVYLFEEGTDKILLARNPAESFQRYRIRGNQIRRHYFNDEDGPIGWMRYVNRYINIYIISPVKSESNFLEQIRQAVKINRI
jgi:hypothetical protein